MDGPSHYKEAERLLAIADRQIAEATSNTVAEVMAGGTLGIAMATAHAQLAHAAATALDPSAWPDSAGHRAWLDVAS